MKVQGHKKGEDPLNENYKFLIIEMDTLAKKNMTARDVCFLVQGLKDLFLNPLMEGRRQKSSFNKKKNDLATVIEQIK